MTNLELVEKAKWIATLPTIYVNGAFGAPMNASNKARYVSNSNNAYNKAHADTILKASASTFGFDCCGLYKGICWGFSAELKKNNGGALYKSNGVPDYSDSGFRRVCDKSTDWSKIVPGALVFLTGHMGIYIGDGLAIEATPKWKNGVQITAVGNIGKKPGYNTRTWECWGKSPYTEYIEEDEDMIIDVKVKDAVTGEILTMKGIYKDGKNYVALSDLAAHQYALVGWDGQYPLLTKVKKCCCGSCD